MTSQLPHFWCLFLSCQQQKNTENGAAVTSLRSFLLRDNFRTHHLWNSTTEIKLFTVSCYGYEQWPPLSSLALPPLPVCCDPPWAACRRLRRRRRSCLDGGLQRRWLVWHQCGSRASSHGAARGVYGSQLFVLKATECQIQHPNVKVLAAFLFARIFPFLLLFFIWLSGKGLHYVNFIGFLKAILGIWT